MWYSACLFFQSVHNERPTDEDFWEEQTILIQSDNEADAEKQAKQIGRRKEHEYISATGDKVRWPFRAASSIFELSDEELKTGTEVHSRFLRAEEVRSLLKPF